MITQSGSRGKLLTTPKREGISRRETQTAVRESLVSGTSATNLTEAEVDGLMNESIKTNLAAQLWFRHAMGG